MVWVSWFLFWVLLVGDLGSIFSRLFRLLRGDNNSIIIIIDEVIYVNFLV